MTAGDAWLEARFAEIRPKAVAALTRQFRDLELAEEAFAVSCLRAVQAWPKRGRPDDPFAWLLAVGRNAGIDILRRAARARDLGLPEPPAPAAEDALIADLDAGGLRDDVLRLLFICCHPDLAPRDQSALALRIVAGLSVAEIARAFLIKPKAMEQRLTRAKRTATRAEVPFETPDLAERHKRLRTVSLMVYLLFNEGWSASTGETQIRTALCEEAIRLARLLLDLFPAVGELMGLLALFLFQHSRRLARLDAVGELVPLDDQDRTSWDRAMTTEARALLEKALRHAAPGPYQIQAAIAAVHAAAPAADDTDWREIERLYAALYLLEPTPVVKLNHAVAVAKVDGPAAALDMLATLADALDAYKWFHTTRAAFLTELGDFGAAGAAYQRALSLDTTAPERRHLRRKITACEEEIRNDAASGGARRIS